MTTVKDVLIYEALEKNKQYKEEMKRKKLSDQFDVKIEKSKLSQSRRKSKLSSSPIVPKWQKTQSKGILIPKKKKKTKRTPKWKKRIELLKRAKAVVYARDKNICQKCMKVCEWRDRQASHVIPVSATGRLALYPLNMKVMCMRCHLNWRHKNPIEASEWFANKFPDRLKELKELKLSIPMWSITLWELEAIEKVIEIEENLYNL